MLRSELSCRRVRGSSLGRSDPPLDEAVGGVLTDEGAEHRVLRVAGAAEAAIAKLLQAKEVDILPAPRVGVEEVFQYSEVSAIES